MRLVHLVARGGPGQGWVGVAEMGEKVGVGVGRVGAGLNG